MQKKKLEQNSSKFLDTFLFAKKNSIRDEKNSTENEVLKNLIF